MGVTLVLLVFLLAGPPAPLSFAARVAQGMTSSQEPQGPLATAAQEPQERPGPPARVARVLLHGPICVVAATMGFIVLAGSFGTTWGSYKALLDEQCVQPFKPLKASPTPSTPSGSQSAAPSAQAPGLAVPATALVIIDATPLSAQVFLDGGLLGSAGNLVGRAVPVPPGRHAVGIVAPRFRPYTTQFAVDGSFPARIRVALLPE